ncbi:MAG TPA: GAF domain-containing protein, partial [Aggregatilineales bacterium]|nr:GAF domain-containing protein [Aggregatilineales bacterium]
MTATAKPQTIATGENSSRFTLDRTTVYGIAVLIVGVLILSGLVALITYLPAQTIAQSIAAQASENQRILAQSLARQAEDYFNSIAYDLLGLSNRPEIKASANTSRVAAMTLLNDEAKQRAGQIKSIVRLGQDGKPLYAWPDTYNQKIQAGQTLPWSVDQSWVDQIVQARAVQYRQVPLIAGGATYLLVAPIDLATTNSEAIAIEVDLDNYFKTNFSSLQLSASSQLWIFDRFGAELFHYREAPIFKGDANKFPQQQDAVVLQQYPTPDRETVAVPVYAAYSQGRGGDRSFTILLSHATAEGQDAITSTLRTLFLVGLAVVLVVMVAGGIVGLFLLRENNRRRQDAQRRSTARTLLTTSRALNSSLELKRVLDLILGELSDILPHDSASILLVDEEEKTFHVAAESGSESIGDGQTVVPFTTLRGAREVAVTGKPVVINDTRTDPRWKMKKGSNVRSWLGVPLRVRDEAVGVLSIDSFAAERFLPDDIDFAEAFAGQAGVAIQNARNHEFQIRTYETELQTARLIQTSL